MSASVASDDHDLRIPFRTHGRGGFRIATFRQLDFVGTLDPQGVGGIHHFESPRAESQDHLVFHWPVQHGFAQHGLAHEDGHAGIPHRRAQDGHGHQVVAKFRFGHHRPNRDLPGAVGALGLLDHLGGLDRPFRVRDHQVLLDLEVLHFRLAGEHRPDALLDGRPVRGTGCRVQIRTVSRRLDRDVLGADQARQHQDRQEQESAPHLRSSLMRRMVRRASAPDTGCVAPNEPSGLALITLWSTASQMAL